MRSIDRSEAVQRGSRSMGHAAHRAPAGLTAGYRASLVLRLQAAAGNRAVQRLLDSTRHRSADVGGGLASLQRDDADPPKQVSGAPSPSKPGSMAVAAFRAMMQARWGVKTIRAGTFEEQQFGGLKRSEWRPWVFDDSSAIYAATAEAFEKLAAGFGGVPPVDTIVFFQTSYKKVGGQAVADPSVGASFDRDRAGQGNLVIYASVVTTNTTPTARQEKGAQKPPREATPDKFAATLRNITHELGHGVEQNVADIRSGQAGPDPALMYEYMTVSGWLRRPGNTVEPLVLYDSGDPSVARAIAANPPDTAVLAAKPRITPENFELSWAEQPITSYMASSPSEDFAEAIMGYLGKPDLLRARAPRRFRFIDQHKSRWLPRLRQPKP